MLFSDYKDDPYSEGNSCNTICCRGDLLKTDPRPNGCYDAKVCIHTGCIKNAALLNSMYIYKKYVTRKVYYIRFAISL